MFFLILILLWSFDFWLSAGCISYCERRSLKIPTDIAAVWNSASHTEDRWRFKCLQCHRDEQKERGRIIAAGVEWFVFPFLHILTSRRQQGGVGIALLGLVAIKQTVLPLGCRTVWNRFYARKLPCNILFFLFYTLYSKCFKSIKTAVCKNQDLLTVYWYLVTDPYKTYKINYCYVANDMNKHTVWWPPPSSFMTHPVSLICLCSDDAMLH